MNKDRRPPLSQLQLLVRETQTISGFSYPFLRLLVDEAERLKEEKELFAIKERYVVETLTPYAESVLRHISNQLGGVSIAFSSSENVIKSDVCTLIEAGQRLLALFEEKVDGHDASP